MPCLPNALNSQKREPILLRHKVDSEPGVTDPTFAHCSPSQAGLPLRPEPGCDPTPPHLQLAFCKIPARAFSANPQAKDLPADRAASDHDD